MPIVVSFIATLITSCMPTDGWPGSWTATYMPRWLNCTLLPVAGG